MLQYEKIPLLVLKYGMLLVPVIPLVVTGSMAYPFITGKNFAFRILIELLLIFWIWLMVVSPGYRPRISLITITFAVFIAGLILSTVFGLSPYKSLWSSYERMEGLFGHLHFFIYFLILGSVFNGLKDWRLFFNISIAVSAIVTIYGFIQLFGGAVIHQGGNRVDASFGNAIYLAVYLFFHLFIIAIYFFQTKISWLKGVYAAIFFMEAMILYYTASRGPIIGFLAGITIFISILAFFEKGRIRRFATGLVVAIIFIPIVFFFIKDTNYISSSDTLGRFVNIFDDPTIKGRLTVWKMAVQAWRERPILGWGQESFTYIFSKYYEPSLWKNEPWFDRAHNVYLDWLTASGIIGLGSYLALFVVALFLCFTNFRTGRIDRFVFAGIVGLFVAYFFQNLLVFDNLTSYILFFGVLAWIHSMSLSEERNVSGVTFVVRSYLITIPIVVFSAAAVIYSLIVFNIRPALAARANINTLSIGNNPDPKGKADALIREFNYGIGLNTFGTAEIREQVYMLRNNILMDPRILPDEKQRYINFLAEEFERQLEDQPHDVRALFFLATVYSEAGRQDDAIAVIGKALEISDKRQAIYFIAADVYLSSNRLDKAVEVLRIAYELEPQFKEAIHNLAMLLISSGKVKEGEDLLEKHFGERIYPDTKLSYVVAYRSIGDLNKATRVLEKLVDESPANANYHAELGSMYFQIGEYKKAVNELERAIELEPGFKARGDEAVKEIKKFIK